MIPLRSSVSVAATSIVALAERVMAPDRVLLPLWLTMALPVETRVKGLVSVKPLPEMSSSLSTSTVPEPRAPA